MKIKLRFTQTKLGLLLMVLFFSSFGRGQTLVAGWDFQTTNNGGTASATSPNSPLVFTANFGTANMYLDGTNGSSLWIKAASGNELTAFGGSNINVSGTSLSAVTTSPACLALLGGATTPTSNGKFIVFKFSMTNYTNLIVSYATQKTATGFSSQVWEYSTDGTVWTSAQTISTIATSFGLITLNTITGLNNATNAYLRFSGGGASNTSGNNRLDNIQFNANPFTTWNGTTWSNGIPTASLDAIIDGTYTTTTNGVFSAKTLTVNTGKSFSISSGHSIAVAGAITNNGSFTLQNNANLIQTNTTAVTNTGNIIVNRNSALIQLYDYTLWSSPVAGQQLQAFSPNTLSTRFYTYDSTQGTNGLYSAVPTPSATNFATATGYLIRAPNTWTAATPTTFNGVFTGVPNNGDVTISGLIAGKYHAVGNPYPSTISVADFYTENPNAGTLYFWRKTNGVAGSAYATRNSAGTTAASGGLTPTADIAVGQGFFVSPSANMTLNFTNAMRATPSNSAVFLRTTEERNRFWLNLTNTSGLFSQMLVGYIQEATSGVDNAIDGRYINDAPTALTSLINSEEYTIQGRALPFTATDTVPLSFKTDVAGNYTIAIDHVDGLFSNGQAVFLKDNLTNTLTNLSSANYTFATSAGVFSNRFVIVFQSTLENEFPVFTASSVIAFAQNGIITVDAGSTILGSVKIIDLRGSVLAEKTAINTSKTNVNIMVPNQVVLVQVTNTNGTVVTKKISL
jgi:hypothetical protein